MNWKKIRMRIIATFAVWNAPHFFIVAMSGKDLESFFKGEEMNPKTMYAGLRDYILKEIIIRMADSIDKDQHVLDKADFYFKAEQRIKSNQP